MNIAPESTQIYTLMYMQNLFRGTAKIAAVKSNEAKKW
jgi:hypothetical protein